MPNLKISELPEANALKGNDLLVVVQEENGLLTTRRTTVSEIKGGAGTSSTSLNYPNGRKAIDASNEGLKTFDINGVKTVELTDEKLKMFHEHTDIKLQAGSVAANSYFNKLTLNDKGLRFEREERDSTSTLIRASQLRLNSADAYLNAKDNVEIAAGTINNDPSYVTTKKLSGGTLRLMAGNKITAETMGAIEVNASASAKVNIEGQININSGGTTETVKGTSSDGESTYENTASIKKDGIKLITKTNGTETNNIKMSNSAMTIKSSKITFQCNDIKFKSEDGKTTYFTLDDVRNMQTLIEEMRTTINSLQSRITALENR